MGTGGRPGKFPATVITVTKSTVTFKAAPEDIEYLKKEIGEKGTLEWTPSSYDAPAGAAAEPADES